MEHLLEQIERHRLSRKRPITEKTFGQYAAGNSRFVDRLRAGTVSIGQVQKVQAYLREQEANVEAPE